MRTTSKNFYPIHSLYLSYALTHHSCRHAHTHTCLCSLLPHTRTEPHTRFHSLSLSPFHNASLQTHTNTTDTHSMSFSLTLSLTTLTRCTFTLSLSHATISPFLMFLDLRIEFIGQPLTRDLFQFVQFFLFRSKRRLTKNEARDIFRIKKHDRVDHHRYPPFPGMDVRKEKNGKI